jgi:Histidine kinase-like ATPase domain
MWEWGMSDLGETVELIVSELVTNAVRASRDAARGGPAWEEGLAYIRLRLASDKRQVLVDVWDRNPQRPVRAAVDSEAESGRGLFLVEVISERWGFYFPAEEPSAEDTPAQGKVVWALVGTALLDIPRRRTHARQTKPAT